MFANDHYRTSAACLLLAVLMLLSACGGGGNVLQAPGVAEGEGQATPAVESSNESTPLDEQARVVQTAKGDIEIPVDPQRVVAGYYHGTLLALGMQPLGASKEWWMGSPFLTGEEAEIADIGSPVSLEKTVELQPDLIVINDLLEDNYDNLSKIAPTLFVPYDSIKNIRDEVAIFGKLLNREKQAEKWLAEYESKAAAARAQLQDRVPPGSTAILLEVDGKTIAALGDNYGRGGEVIYNALQFKAPEFIKREVIDSGVQYLEISLESLTEIEDADFIFLSTYTETTEAQLKALTDSALWNSLKAVKNNNVIHLDYKTFFYFDPLSTLGQIDVLTDQLMHSDSQ
jgi:iron complex transport system substrate-binding protein